MIKTLEAIVRGYLFFRVNDKYFATYTPAQRYRTTIETGDLEYQSFLAKCISDAYILNGNYKEANSFLNKYLELKDSVYTIESNVLIENLTTEREVLLKDKQIEIDNISI